MREGREGVVWAGGSEKCVEWLGDCVEWDMGCVG